MPITIKLGDAAKKPQATVELQVSTTLDGNLLIKDHQKLDIVVVPGEGKVLAIPKSGAPDNIYDYQRELMDSLFQGGVVNYESIQGGSVFGVLEGYYETKAEGVDAVQVALLEIEKYIKKSLAEDAAAEEYDENIEDRFTNPTPEDSTAWGAIKPEQDDPNRLQDPGYFYVGGRYLY